LVGFARISKECAQAIRSSSNAGSVGESGHRLV
jgi:hypothetical protein